MKYACIAAERDSYPVALMCRVLQVARPGFYAWLVRAPSARAQADARLRLEIRRAVTVDVGPRLRRRAADRRERETCKP